MPTMMMHITAVARRHETMPAASLVEKFPMDDLSDLRMELMQTGVDTWQAAEMISSFLAGRGYGVSNDAARCVVSRMEGFGCSLETMQVELEGLAYVM